jgi:hypothetical protein
MRSQPSSASSYRLPRFFEPAAFFVAIRVFHDERTMSDSDYARNHNKASNKQSITQHVEHKSLNHCYQVIHSPTDLLFESTVASKLPSAPAC